jgi:hypothetical protein
MAEIKFDEIVGATGESHEVELRRGMVVRIFYEAGILQLSKDWDWGEWATEIRNNSNLKKVLSLSLDSVAPKWQEFLGQKYRT